MVATKQRSHSEALEIRGSRSSHIASMATTADLMTLQQQLRQEIANSLQRVREDMADWMQSGASPVPCRGSQQVLQKQPSRTESAT